MEILLHECSDCGITYGTLKESGEHECPQCGHVETFVDFTELLPVKLAALDEITSVGDAREVHPVAQ